MSLRWIRNLVVVALVVLSLGSRPPWRPDPHTPLAIRLLVDEACSSPVGDRERLRLLSKAVELDPTSTRALNEHALVLEKLDIHPEALAVLDAAIDLEPASATLLFNRGNIHLALDRADLAVQDYTASLRIEESSEAFLNRGCAYLSLNKRPEAEADLREALRLYSGPPGIRERIQQALDLWK